MNWRAVAVVAFVVVLVTGGVAVGAVVADDDGQDDELETGIDGDAKEPGSDEREAAAGGASAAQQGGPEFVRGSPDLEVHVPDPTVTPGETQEVQLLISNAGDQSIGPASSRDIVTSARAVTVEADADRTPLTVESGSTAIGTVTDAQPGEAPIAISVPDDVEAGTYSVDVDISYSYTRQQSSGGTTQDQSRTMSTTFDVEVDDDARFSVVDVDTDTQIGDTGTMEIELENIGEERADNVNVAFESMGAGLTFGESPQDASGLESLEPGETANVTYDIAVADDTSVRYYPLEGSVQFETPDGLDRVDEGISTSVRPLPEQRFSVTDVHSDLYVGEDGDLEGVITNEGPEVRNAVVRITDESPNVVPIEESVAVGDLDSGESARFSLPVDISGEAEAVDREIDLAVQYRNEDLQQRLFEDTAAIVDVNEQRDQFLLDVQDRQISAGEDKLVDVEVTNNLDQTVTDVEARLFASDPLDSDDDEGFVEELEPGETVTMTFDLEAESGTTPSTRPISFDFRYDDERGNSQLSDTTRVAIEVTESEGGIPWLIVGTIVLTGLGAGAYAYQRR